MRIGILLFAFALIVRADDKAEKLKEAEAARDRETILKDLAEIKAAGVLAQAQYEKTIAPFTAEFDVVVARRCAAEKIERAKCDVDKITGTVHERKEPEKPKTPAPPPGN